MKDNTLTVYYVDLNREVKYHTFSSQHKFFMQVTEGQLKEFFVSYDRIYHKVESSIHYYYTAMQDVFYVQSIKNGTYHFCNVHCLTKFNEKSE